MERHEINAVCRLCLRDKSNLINVFESKTITGWTAADGIHELIQMQVSADDIYPQWVCICCMGKLEDFKVFKDQCESSKDLLDRAYAGKREIERDEELVGGLNFRENHRALLLNEDDINLLLERDPLDLTDEVVGNQIKSEVEDCVNDSNEMSPSEAFDPYDTVTNVDEEPLMALERDPKRVPSSWPLTALDSEETITMKYEISPSCVMTGDDSEIANDEHVSQEEEESDPSVDTADVKPNVSELNIAPTPLNEECQGEGFNNKSDGEFSVLSRTQGRVYISQVMGQCSSVHNSEKSTAKLRTTDKGLLPGDSDCRESRLEGPRLERNGIEDHGTALPSRPSRRRRVIGEYYPHRAKSDGSNRSGFLRSGTNDPEVLSSPANTVVGKGSLRRDVELGVGVGMGDSKVHLAEGMISVDPSSGSRKTVDGKTGMNGKSNGISKKWECHVCRKKFSRNYFRAHFRSHPGEKAYKCGECENAFGDLISLRVHKLTHATEKQFSCTVCPKIFRNKKSFRKHLRTHSMIKNFGCEICKKRFSQGASLRQHFRTHTGEKPFECEICMKTFTQKSSLKKHLLTHPDEMPYGCMF